MQLASLGNFHRMQKNIHVRLAMLSDLPDLLAIEESSLKTTWTKEMIRASFFQNDDIWLFHNLNQQRIGYAIFRSDGEALVLLQFCLAAHYRGRGLGKESLQWCLNYYQATHHAIFLEVAVDNLEAFHCYQNLGFDVIGERKGYYFRAGERIDAKVMRIIF
jgi:[ribosomal protein S18]-alanine N-acetyltransferase